MLIQTLISLPKQRDYTYRSISLLIENGAQTCGLYVLCGRVLTFANVNAVRVMCNHVQILVYILPRVTSNNLSHARIEGRLCSVL